MDNKKYITCEPEEVRNRYYKEAGDILDDMFFNACSTETARERKIYKDVLVQALYERDMKLQEIIDELKDELQCTVQAFKSLGGR